MKRRIHAYICCILEKIFDRNQNILPTKIVEQTSSIMNATRSNIVDPTNVLKQCLNVSPGLKSVISIAVSFGLQIENVCIGNECEYEKSTTCTRSRSGALRISVRVQYEFQVCRKYY